MADKISEYIVSIGGDASDLRSIWSTIKSQVRSDVAELEKITNSADLFSQLSTNLPKVEAAMRKATDRATELRQEIQRIEGSGGKATDELTKSLAQAEKAAAAATKEYARQNTEAASLSARLKTAGVDTSKLATEQVRLADALKQANAAATQQSAKSLLGFTVSKDVEPEVQKLTAAFDTLRKSGTLSATEIAAAERTLHQRIQELRDGVTSLHAPIQQADAGFTSFLTGAVARAAAPIAVLTVLYKTYQAATEAEHAFLNETARLATVTNLSREELQKLGTQVRDVAAELGVPVQDALKATFELIRSGVSPDNALEVLRASAIAAKGSLTDIGTAGKAANAILSGLGIPISELGRALDIVVQGAKDGGATLTEFANNAGPLINVAKAAGISFEDMVATLTVMTNATGDASLAIGDLQRIIVKLNTADARAKLRDLGIEGNDLVGIFTQLGKRGLGVDQFLELGLASTKSALGVSVLTDKAGQLSPELAKLQTSAGAAAKAMADLEDTPQGRNDRFNAQLDKTLTNLGSLFGKGSFLQRGAAEGLTEINQIFDGFHRMGDEADRSGSSILSIGKSFFFIDPAAQAAAKSIAQVGQATAHLGSGIYDGLSQINKARQNLDAFSTELVALVQTLQQAAGRDTTDLATRADAEIAALDRSTKAAGDTAAKTLAIQLQLGADKLAVIRKSESDITAAVQAALASRELVQRAAGVSEAKIAQDSAQARIAAVGPILASYQGLYTNLIGLAQSSAATMNSIDQSRIEFNRGVENTLREFRRAGDSEFQVYLNKIDDVNRLIAEARETAQRGGTENLAKAKQLTDEAIATAKSIGPAVTAEGVQIVTQLQATTTRAELVKKASDSMNASFAAAGEAAKAGKEGFETQAKEVGKIIAGLQAQYDDLKKSVADGLALKLELDERSVKATIDRIDELTKPRTVQITVQPVSGTGAPADTGFGMNDRGVGGLNRGGYAGLFRTGGPVGRALASSIGPIAQEYASGGSVFRRPTWSKVPGIGNQDTVPAMLQAGSFVIRKQASQKYGDGVMGALAAGWPVRRFASGGSATNSPDFREGGSLPVPKLPSDPDELKRMVLRYVTDIKAAALGEGYFYWRASLDALGYATSWYERFPTEENLLAVLQRARNIGLNLGASKGTLEGFDVDGKKWHKSRVNISGQLQSIFNYEFFKRGGRANAGTDSVRALLTPGEYVINKQAASALGGNLLHSINSMRISPQTLAGMMARSTMMQVPRRFETGGLVPGAAIMNGPSDAGLRALGGSHSLAVTINASPSALLNRENVLRYIVPEIDALLRRSGKTIGS